MNSRKRRVPGARWWWSQGMRLRQFAASDHAAAVADHHHDAQTMLAPLSGPAPAGLPKYGTTADLPGGATAPARVSTTATNL